MSTQDQIDQYILGKLKDSALERFEEAMKNDPALSNEVEARKLVLAGIRSLNNEHLRQKMKTIHREEYTSIKHKKPIRKIYPFLLAAAASVILLIIAWQFVFQAPSSDKLFAQFYQPYEASFTQRDGSSDQLLNRAEFYYRNGNFKATLPVLDSIILNQPQNFQVKMAKGICHLEEHELEEASRGFTEIIDQNVPLLVNQAKWYLALTSLKQNNLKKSELFLEQLATNPSADYNKEAKELLESLNQISD